MGFLSDMGKMSDQLHEGEPRGKTKVQAKGRMARHEGQRAWDEGREVFVLQTRNTFSGQAEGSVKGVAEAIEEAETVGWKYQSSTYAFDQRGKNSLVGIHFFRRSS